MDVGQRPQEIQNMKTTKIAAMIMAVAIAMSVAPLASADACSGNDCYKKTATGPGGANVKFFGSAGLGFCLAPGLPLPCLEGGGGGVFFNVSSYNAPGVSSVSVSVWAEFIGGGVSQPDPELEGFDMTVCSDRDDNSVCSPDLDSPDLYEVVYSDGAEVGKDDGKDDDSLQASWSGCLEVDEANLFDPAQEFDDLVVFVGAWADNSAVDNLLDDEPGNGENDGAGASVGQFDIYLSVGSYGC